jgi:hypothetical protein
MVLRQLRNSLCEFLGTRGAELDFTVVRRQSHNREFRDV